jgi:hypothetical protein
MQEVRLLFPEADSSFLGQFRQPDDLTGSLVQTRHPRVDPGIALVNGKTPVLYRAHVGGT